MLSCKNVIVNGRRTSMRLDREICQSLSDICNREDINLNELCSKIDSVRGKAGLSCSVRLFVLVYVKNLLKQQTTPEEINKQSVLEESLLAVQGF